MRRKYLQKPLEVWQDYGLIKKIIYLSAEIVVAFGIIGGTRCAKGLSGTQSEVPLPAPVFEDEFDGANWALPNESAAAKRSAATSWIFWANRFHA